CVHHATIFCRLSAVAGMTLCWAGLPRVCPRRPRGRQRVTLRTDPPGSRAVPHRGAHPGAAHRARPVPIERSVLDHHPACRRARLADRRHRPWPTRPRALVLVPTRELAAQVERDLAPLARALGLRVLSVYGGTSMNVQIRVLRRGVDVVVATPGRLTDLIERR